MNTTIKTGVLALSVIALLGAATASSAETRWQLHHPRRVEVNARLANQNRRIIQERREGEISLAQARDLHAEDRGIRGQERFDASHHDSHLTRAEQAQLNREENGVSHQIGH
jgi:hypothetical protein